MSLPHLRHPRLEPVLAALAAHPVRDRLRLRGGVVTAALVHPAPRVPDDVDLLAVGAPLDAVADEVADALAPLGPVAREPLWPGTAFPGVRFVVGGVQVDLGFGDPVAGTVPLHGLLAADRVTHVAWKLHGLWEREGAWRPKDLHDLWLLLQSPIDPDALRAAIVAAFTSRDAPLPLARRLLDGRLGRSPDSRRSWRRHLAEHPERPSPSREPAVVAERVAEALRPAVGPLVEAVPPLFPALDGALDEVRALTAATPGFRELVWDDHVVFTYEGARDFPDPERAVTWAERRRRQVLRELRGLAFDADGRVVARKLHKFFGLDPERPPREGPAEAVEKLDGSLVAAQRTRSGLRLVTRRGPSSLGDDAAKHAAGALGAVGAWVDEGYTPLFEWCTPAHPIVLGHAAPALFLVALRRRVTGEYAPQDDVDAAGREAGLPTPRRFGRVDPAAFLAEVAGWRDREGVIFVWPDGTRAKGKADLYRWCHRLVEGPGAEQAMWWLALHHEEALVREVTARRGVDVEPALRRVRQRLEARAAALAREVDPAQDRKALALATEGQSAAERRLRFRVHGGEDPEVVVRDAVLLALRDGRDPADVVGG